jgi:RNA polymerase sigma-70 factor (ECF subfamily)
MKPDRHSGDIAAFEELFRTLHAPLCEVADSYVRSQDIAEEIVQDVFFVVWMKRDRVPRGGGLRPYLFTAVRNRALHHLRHRAIVRRLASWVSRADLAGVAAPQPSIDEAFDVRERRAAVRRAIDQLPPRARLALVLQRDHDMTNAAIADAMGISLKGVEKLLATARQKLRPLLEAEGEGAR